MLREMLELCPTCRGEGVDPTDVEEKTCEGCEGAGIIDEVTCDLCGGQGCARCGNSGSFFNVECPHCEMQGIVHIPIRCPTCRGQKTIVHSRLLNKD